MNRLVIVGNGFDLAHGLKTSYEDFLLDYFNGIFSQNQFYEDELMSVKLNPNFSAPPIGQNEFKSIQDLTNSKLIKKERGETASAIGVQYLITFKSKFFQQLLNARNWTDIESAYFNYLLSQLNSFNDYRAVDLLNKEFNYLKNKLGEYLNKVNNSTIRPLERNNIFNAIESTFDKARSISHLNKLEIKTGNESFPDKVLFINFNYTSLLNEYIKLLSVERRNLSSCLPIHGSINDPESIIFGYGDETHEKYKYLENQDNDALLMNIKSFYYPAKSHYQELMDFISFGNFDVFVIGHSLGLSDRVLLKTIFENDYCKAIKLFHRGTESSQFRKRIAISRHFDDKIAMRNKILHYNSSDVFGR